MLKSIQIAIALSALALGACSQQTGSIVRDRADQQRGDSPERSAADASAGSQRSSRTPRVDPRRGGFEVGLAEWTVTSEAAAIRPGPVTFVISNRGTMAHGFEIELEGDSSGSGSGDLFKAESRLLEPGETVRLRMSLPEGVFKVECLVEGHDDRGMEGFLEVRKDAPLKKRIRPRPDGQIEIADLSFQPAIVNVHEGTHVIWTNKDPTEHTVTAENGAFGSQALGSGDTFSFHAGRPGTYRYACAIHPEMKGVLKVG